MRMRSQLGLRLVLCALAVPSLASAQGSNAPPPQTHEDVLRYAEKVVGDAEAREKAASTAPTDFAAIQRRLQQLRGELKECDRLLAAYIEKNPADVVALFLQVRLDRVKYQVFPIQRTGDKVTSDVPAPERDPQQTLARILALNPNNAEAYYWKARLYGIPISVHQDTSGKLSAVVADLPKAIEFGRKAVSSAPQNVAYREALAAFLMGSGSFAEATDVLKPIQNGQHPAYRLLLDRSRMPIPEGSASHTDLEALAAAGLSERGQDYPGLRVAAYVAPKPASEVEAFYLQHWNGFKLYEMGAQEPNLRGTWAYLHWQGAELQLVKEKPPDDLPSNALLIVVMEWRNPTEDVKKRLPVPVGDVFSVIQFINTRELGKP